MIALLFIWDSGSLHPWTELNMWKQLAEAFQVDLVIMIPNLKMDLGSGTVTFEAYDTVEEALASHPELKRVFLEPKSIVPDAIDLKDYVHEDNVIYIFGNSAKSNVGLITEDDTVVSVDTPNPDAQLWAIEVASIVLYDRKLKQG
ncbi:MAG: hypothetical protein DRP15_01715 [Candidatus Aenigmatarchaeota archaeon]|nr:MAG: hypothetical protein DRP15_01715 [Candidatus Aenigmarchaeota archaeon]